MTATPDTPSAERAAARAWTGLRDRLVGGVLPSVNDERGPVRVSLDARELADSALAPPLALLRALWKDEATAPSKIARVITELTRILGARRPLLMAVLGSPGRLLDRIPELIGEPATEVADCWVALCWITEAAWKCVTELPGGATTDRRLLGPLAARLRFLVLSEPFRHRGRDTDPWLATCRLSQFGHDGLFGKVFGDDSWHELVGRCREARWTWQEALDGFQSHPLLAMATSSGLEAELGLLVFRTGHAGWPLVVSRETLTLPGKITADDRAIADDMADRHLLPRFQLTRVAALALITSTRWRNNWRIPLMLPPCVSAATAITLAAHGHFRQAAWLALGTYLLIGLGALFAGRMFAAPWLLRLPAAATAGLLLLITLPPAWWATPNGGWGPPAALVAAALGYLIIEVRNHGAARGATIVRALGVGAAGALHSFLVCLAGLVLIAPAYVDTKTKEHQPIVRISSRFTAADLAGSWYLLSLAASFCLAVGVFSQILWQDRPITAPLAHSRWRSGR
jgi:hypothetical protein